MQWRHYMQRLLHHFREFFGRRWLSWVLVISRGYLFQISWFSFAVFAIREGVVISRRILQGWEVLRGGFLLVELLFRGWFSVLWRIIEVPTCWRRITKAPACWWRITKAPAYCWSIIEASTCWLEDYRASCLFGSLCRYFCLLQRAYLIDSSIGIAADFVAGYLG